MKDNVATFPHPAASAQTVGCGAFLPRMDDMNTRWSGWCAAAFLLTMAGAVPVAQGAPMVGITDLGTQSVFGIDNAGEVLLKGGLYRNGMFAPFVPGTTDPLPSAAISPGGTIAYNPGHGGFSANMTAHVLKDGKAFDAGTASDGPLVGGDGWSFAQAVNDAGTVAGESHALGRWNRAFMSAMGPYGQYYPVAMGANGGATSDATAINNHGTVVGWSDVATQWRNHAFVGTPRNDIGTLGGLNSAATGINDKGQVVGWSTIATGYVPPAHPNGYYDPGAIHAFLYQNGKMTDLGTLPGFKDSAAEAINASGQIVGQLAFNSSVDPARSLRLSAIHAALFFANGGSPTDLNSLLPPGSGWVLNDAVGINDSGHIIGYGTYQGQTHAYLLALPTQGLPSPAPEPPALAIFGLTGSAFLLLRRRATGATTRSGCASNVGRIRIDA